MLQCVAQYTLLLKQLFLQMFIIMSHWSGSKPLASPILLILDPDWDSSQINNNTYDNKDSKSLKKQDGQKPGISFYVGSFQPSILASCPTQTSVYLDNLARDSLGLCITLGGPGTATRVCFSPRKRKAALQAHSPIDWLISHTPWELQESQMLAKSQKGLKSLSLPHTGDMFRGKCGQVLQQ